MPKRWDIKYIRFGGLPESGYSWNYRDNKPELGISCYRLIYDGQRWRIDGAQSITTLNFLQEGVPCYEVEGDLLKETGSDDEPLLVNVQIIKRIRAYHWPGRLNRIGGNKMYSAWEDEFTGEITLDLHAGRLRFESREAIQSHYESLLSFSEYFAEQFWARCEAIGYYLLETIS